MLCRADEIGPQIMPKACEALSRNTHLLSQLVEDLLDISRIAAGKIQLAAEDVNLCDVAGEGVRMMQQAADHKGVSIWMERSGACIVTGDAMRLRQVVSNLLTNAVKFTGAGGTVSVSLRSDHGRST